MFGFDNRCTLPLFGMSNSRIGTMSPLSPKVKRPIHLRREEILSNATEVNQETDDASGKNTFNEKDEKLSFGIRPNTKDPDFDFKKELE